MPTTTTPPTTGIPSLDIAIAATGFRWRNEPAFLLADIVDHIQHRSSDRLDKAAIIRYRRMFKAGSIPPPIGVTRDGYVLFGNHRLAAAKAEGRESLPAVVIEVDGVDAKTDEFLRNSLLSIATRENAPHGVPYNGTDRHDRAATLLNLGYTSTKIQAELGLSASQVSNIKKEVEASQRLASLGIDEEGLPRAIKQALAAPDVKALNTEPFRQLVDLAREAKLVGPEIKSIAGEARATGSDNDAMAHIASVRTDMEPRITEIASTGTTARPTPVGKLRGALRGVATLCDAGVNPSIYRDHTDQSDETRLMLEDAIACLSGILAVQEDVLP